MSRCFNLYTRSDVSEDLHDKEIDREGDERALNADDDLFDGDSERPKVHDLIGWIIRDAIEHDACHHAAHEQGQAARHPLQAGEVAVLGTHQNGQPEVAITDITYSPCGEQVSKLVQVFG